MPSLSVDADVVLLGRSAISTDETESEALFSARRLAYPAIERLGPFSPVRHAAVDRACGAAETGVSAGTVRSVGRAGRDPVPEAI